MKQINDKIQKIIEILIVVAMIWMLYMHFESFISLIKMAMQYPVYSSGFWWARIIVLPVSIIFIIFSGIKLYKSKFSFDITKKIAGVFLVYPVLGLINAIVANQFSQRISFFMLGLMLMLGFLGLNLVHKELVKKTKPKK